MTEGEAFIIYRGLNPESADELSPARLAHAITVEARGTYIAGSEQVADAAQFRARLTSCSIASRDSSRSWSRTMCSDIPTTFF